LAWLGRAVQALKVFFDEQLQRAGGGFDAGLVALDPLHRGAGREGYANMGVFEGCGSLVQRAGFNRVNKFVPGLEDDDILDFASVMQARDFGLAEAQAKRSGVEA
jgi:hypothetical protein